MKRRVLTLVVAVAALLIAAANAWGQRRITPVNTAATTTQSINETKNDTARINAAKRATMVHYHDDNGRVIYIDTVTGREWVDSTALPRKIPMKYPLLVDASVGVNVWDPLMRLFGQKYGLIDGFVQVNLHNRYFPTFEIGVGTANSKPDDMNFTYKSPLSVYFKVGIDYNFLYNSNPDYKFFAGVRYGYAPFKYKLTDVSIGSDYWGAPVLTEIPEQSATAGWLEMSMGLRVKIWGPISAGWTFKYHWLLNQSKSQYGRPWYIPGYGSRGSKIAGAFSIVYTLPLGKHKAPSPDDGTPALKKTKKKKGKAAQDTEQADSLENQANNETIESIQ